MGKAARMHRAARSDNGHRYDEFGIPDSKFQTAVSTNLESGIWNQEFR